MFSFDTTRFTISDLLRAALKAHDQRCFTTEQIVPIEVSSLALEAIKDLIFLCLCQRESGYGLKKLINFTDYTPDQKETYISLTQSVLDRIMKNNALNKNEEIFAVMQKTDSDEYRFSLLWASYFHALVHPENSPALCLSWLHASLAINDASRFFHYGDRNALKAPIDHMTDHVAEHCKWDNSFSNRFDAALLALELNHHSDFKRIS